MATVTGDYAINFAPLPSQSPYTHPDFVAILNQGNARIDAGVWRSVDGANDVGWQLDPERFPVSGDVIRSRIEVSDIGGGYDGILVGVLDSDGNGYRVQVYPWGLSRHRLDAWTPFNDTGAEAIVAISSGDQVELEYDKSTGAVRAYHNGSPVSGLNLTDATYSGNTLAPAFVHAPGDQGQGGIISFAADGVVVPSGNLAADAAAVASASADLSTQVRMAAAAAGAASGTAELTTAIRLAADAVSRAAATGVLDSGAQLAASASVVATATAALTTAMRFQAAAASAASASARLIDWATVTLSGQLYDGPGGVLDPNFWQGGAAPTVGTTLYYDPTHIEIHPNAEISSDVNDCTAIVMFRDGAGEWHMGLVIITPHLAAYARGEATAAAQLTTAIHLSAAAEALATVAATFSTGAGLEADAAAQADASAGLTTRIPLSALADSLSTAAAALTNEILLAADAAAEASATADMGGVVSLNAAATAVSTALASLTTQIRLGAAAQGEATLAGSLRTGIRLAGEAQSIAHAAGALSTAITLGGSISNVASATADLTTLRPLMAAAVNVATAVATLSTGINLRANASAISSAAASLVSAIELMAEARAESTATAVLTDVISTPPAGIYATDPRYVVAKSRWLSCGYTPRFSCKDPAERVVLTFDFADALLEDETLEGPITFTIATTAGNDEDANALFDGYPAYDSTKKMIQQPIKGGMPCRDYYIKVKAGTSNAHKTVALAGLLAVRG